MTIINGTSTGSPATPIVTPDTSRVFTLQGLVSHVMDVYDLSDNEMDVRRAKRAAMWGYEQAMTRHQWNLYDDETTVYLNAEDKTGTISINSSGVVTRAETWPSWSALGSLYIDDERSYRVKTRDSDTQITLEDWNGQDEAPTTYSLRQDRVLIPDDVREVYDVWHHGKDRRLSLINVKDFREYDRPRTHSGSDPQLVCFRMSMLDGKSKTELRVSPAATTAIELDIAYARSPRDPKVLEFCTGVNASGNTVTLATPMPIGISLVGSLIRVAATTTSSPESELGFGVATEVPVAFEGFITSQTSTTVFIVAGVPAMTDGKLVITDTLDVSPRLLLAVKSYAEAQMSRIGRGDIREYRTLMVEADEQLRYAMERGSLRQDRGGQSSVQVDRLVRTIYVSES